MVNPDCCLKFAKKDHELLWEFPETNAYGTWPGDSFNSDAAYLSGFTRLLSVFYNLKFSNLNRTRKGELKDGIFFRLFIFFTLTIP